MGEIAQIRPNAEQIEEVVGWLIEGQRESEVERRLAQAFPGVAPAALATAVADRLRTAARCERDVAVGFALEAYRAIYAKAVAVGDLTQARGAMKD